MSFIDDKAFVKYNKNDNMWEAWVGSKWMGSWENSRDGHAAALSWARAWNIGIAW